MSNEMIVQQLTDLIDETLNELEDLKKSRFAASEIKIEGPGEDLAGKPANGKLDKEEDKDEEEDEKDEDKAEKAEDKSGKSEDKEHNKKENEKLDELKDMHKKEDDDKKSDKKDDMDKGEDKKEEKKEDKKEEMDKGEDWGYKLKKSQEESETLFKSYVDQKISPLEKQLSTILDAVNKLANQPVAPKGATAKMVPLKKSDDSEVAPLSKSDVANKLFDLKKSGSSVDSLDIAKAELGQDLQVITKKYNLQ